jgi:hypothetical protein
MSQARHTSGLTRAQNVPTRTNGNFYGLYCPLNRASVLPQTRCIPSNGQITRGVRAHRVPKGGPSEVP